MMQYFTPFLLSAGNGILKNYDGGTNPILVVIFLILLCFIILCGIAYLVWEALKILKFNKVCTQSHLTGEEIGFLRTFIRRLHIKHPLKVLTKRSEYDSFMNKVSHYYESLNLSEEDLLPDVQAFSKIRQKLSFTHKFRSKRLSSSRAIPVGHNLQITHYDLESKSLTAFKSKILQNNDFYINISPPPGDYDVEMFLKPGSKQRLEVCFRRPKEPEYLFDSMLIRTSTNPRPMWYIRHSDTLSKGDPLKKLDIPGSVLITHADSSETEDEEESDEGKEFSMRIAALSNRECLFTIENLDRPLNGDHKILMSFELNKIPLTTRGKIIKSVKRKDSLSYLASFNDLSPEDYVTITTFAIQKKSGKK
ncbi:MAG: hypothetical protein CMO81_04515 [Waddliaceae bacterium]|nr:hypothetical protein [Waddliaceae bacterium]